MATLREWIDRALGTLRLRRADADLEAELRAHAEMAGGGYAGRVAVTQAMDAMRDRRGLPWLHALSADVVFAWRQLRAHRVVSAAAILSLGLAMGAATAAFRLVDATLLRPLPIVQPDRFWFAITSFVDAQGRVDYYDNFDYPTYRRYRELVGDRATLLVVGSSHAVEATVPGAAEPERINRQFYSGNVFGAFGLQPALGRLLGPADDRVPGGHPVAVLAYDYWRRRFGADPAALGAAVRIGQTAYQVIGVAPRGFVGTEPGRSADVFVPAVMNAEALDVVGWSWFRLWILPRAGVTAAAVEQVLHADFSSRVRAELADAPADTPRNRIEARLRERLSLLPAGTGASPVQKNFRRPLLVLTALVGAVLLIACVNVANLLTGQALARRREMALRVSIGAGRWRLVRLLLVESALMALLASLVGAAIGWWAAPFVVSMLAMPQDPVRLAMDADWRLLAFGTALTVVVTVTFGLLPALRASTVAPNDVLRSGGRATSHRRLTYGLIAAQTAFCVFVLFVTVLFVSTFARLSATPLGFRADRLLVVDVEARPAPDGEMRWNQAADEVRALPGVTTVTRAGWALLGGSRWRRDVRVAGQPPQPEPAHALAVVPGYFAALEIPLLEGRDLRAGDRAAAIDEQQRPTDGIGVVNQAFARAYFAGRSPVGQTVDVQVRPNVWAPVAIVGLVGDTVYANLRDPLRPAMYVPAEQKGTATLLIRTVGEPDAIAPLVRRIVARARPDARIRLVVIQEQLIARQLLRERLVATLSAFVAGVALLLSAIGLYGVLHHAVVLQQRQIGIRMALGARAAQVVRQVTTAPFVVVAAGAGLGLAGGVVFGRAVESLLFRVGATDASVLATPLAILALAAVAAALPPALRAVRIDPARTLRAE